MGQILAKSFCKTGPIFWSEFWSLADHNLCFLPGHQQIPYFRQFQNFYCLLLYQLALFAVWNAYTWTSWGFRREQGQFKHNVLIQVSWKVVERNSQPCLWICRSTQTGSGEPRYRRTGCYRTYIVIFPLTQFSTFGSVWLPYPSYM